MSDLGECGDRYHEMITSDEELLREFASNGSNAAFAELVHRYLGLVYSAAKRQVPSSALAEDIAQSVFIDMSKNAGKFASFTLRSL